MRLVALSSNPYREPLNVFPPAALTSVSRCSVRTSRAYACFASLPVPTLLASRRWMKPLINSPSCGLILSDLSTSESAFERR